MATCYMCQAEATSDEHVPPACIFPEKKDLPAGLDFRKNLITVPSCGEHNLSKSGDDEYLLYVITSNISTNEFAQMQWATKVKRSYKKRPTKLRMFGTLFPVRLPGTDTGGFYLDKDRIDTELDRICRGLYFATHHLPWLPPIAIVSSSFVKVSGPDAQDFNVRSARLRAIVARYLDSRAWHGDNPEIFEYQLQKNEEPLGLAIRMIFFGHFEVAAISVPSMPVNEGDA